ncbi:Probable serine/threonine-protein kinase SIS8 [Linum grandiflorum]
MCNQGVECMSDTMDTPTSATNSNPSTADFRSDEAPRVKFLCSFLGNIMPRPQDGKLRYVGGETRIVSLPRDIGYEELMGKMRELYDGAAVLKYQQPDEDLDALVSVVNDDDVTNMMEEYEKLGSGDGFTRLRIFLFSQSEQDGSPHFVDGVDDRETERRYVDALNNLNEGRLQLDSPTLMGGVDDVHLQEQFFGRMSLDGGLHGVRSHDIPLQYNLRHVAVPQRYSEMEGPWSPAYYSPRHHGHPDQFPNSPPSARYRMPFGDVPPDKAMDNRVLPEEYARSQLNHHTGAYEPHPQAYSENVPWMHAGDKAGFPGNLLHGQGGVEGNSSACDHCHTPFQRSQVHLDQASMGNGLPHAVNSCNECTPNREGFMGHPDPNVQHHSVYPKDQADPRNAYNESRVHERGWLLQHQASPRTDEARSHLSGAGRFNEHYIVDGPGMNYSLSHGAFADGHHVSSSYAMGNEAFPDPSMTPGHRQHVAAPVDDRSVRYGNFPGAYGTETIYQMPHGHAHGQSLWRNVPNPMLGGPFEASTGTPQVNGTVNPAYIRGTVEGGPRVGAIGIDTQQPWSDSSQARLGFDTMAVPDYAYAPAVRTNNAANYGVETSLSIAPEPSRHPLPREMTNSLAPIATVGHMHGGFGSTGVPELAKQEVTNVAGTEVDAIYADKLNAIHVADTNPEAALVDLSYSNNVRNPDESNLVQVGNEKNPSASAKGSKLSVDGLSYLPELIASAKKAALEEAEEVKARVEEDASHLKDNTVSKEAAQKESEAANGNEEVELDHESENSKLNKIEPTKAEAEAIEKGLQTIRNDDLEEIRELGSGTYGAVYHGKWKGSDVAIKRIKASCFAGRPSERARLIADFWKEALILSSLHHPNVVSFYGIVRDGPDGSLATVTEFMVNGSLKQFLQKKDRTIDRRKRLIIAMDAAFGMEYLHGKNIVHFDLKCENLLVNMRDPQRPICKIGDLGLSKVKQQTLVSGGVRGTLPWMAPELLSGKNHMVTEKIDVYSFGIVMWELLTGEEPYADMHCASIIGGIVNNTLRPKIPTWCDPEWKSLMESCWASEPSERPSFSEISRKLRTMAAAINVK